MNLHLFARCRCKGDKYNYRFQCQGGSARRNADKTAPTKDCIWNVITIGANGPYRRRKRSDLNLLTSVRCEGIGKHFFCIFLKRMKSFLWYFFFLPHISGRYEYFFLKLYFLCIFSCFFGIRLCIFSNNLVFTICLYGNYIYVLFFQILTFLKLCLVFAKLLKN